MEAPRTYCVIPPGTDPGVVERLERLYADDPFVRVVIERRSGLPKRRKRATSHVSRKSVQRRLPPEIARIAPDVRLEDHLPPISDAQADQDIEFVALQAGTFDPEAATELRFRCHTKVTSMLIVRLGTAKRAERMFPRVMDQVQVALKDFPPDEDFDEWLVDLIDGMDLQPN